MKKKEIIFGIHPTIDAIEQGVSISKLWIKSPSQHVGHKKIMRLAQEKGIPCSRVPLVKLRQLTSEQHQGVVGLRSPIHFVPISHIIQEAFSAGRAPLLVVLSHIEDTRNLGAIIRTASATAVDAIVIPLQGAAAIDGKTMKTSAGALATLPICRVHDLRQTLIYLQESGLQVIACTEKTETLHYTVDYKPPTALLMGGESCGIPKSYLAISNKKVKIPMQGPMNSLNLGVATAVVLYEAVRQRGFS